MRLLVLSLMLSDVCQPTMFIYLAVLTIAWQRNEKGKEKRKGKEGKGEGPKNM